MDVSPAYELTARQAAARLGFSVDTVKRWARNGELAHWRTPGGYYRFTQADLDAFVIGRTRTPEPAA